MAVSEYDEKVAKAERRFGVHYKWIALSNTTLGALMASIDSSIVLISLPAIFAGLGINPLAPANIGLLLWMLLGYTITSSVIVVSVGRLSDMFGRVRLYNLGFLIFAVSSVLICISSYLISGPNGALSLIVLRLVQGIGGGFLFANSTAIITDAFPRNERGRAMGINQVAFIVGSVAGLIIGGILASIDWHLIFLISVPVGVIGAIWAYIGLHELSAPMKGRKIDVIGNVTFALALILILVSLTYALIPYGTQSTGWSSPFVIGGLALGILLLAVFIAIEIKVREPMFHLALFKIRAFASGILSLFLAGIARGGLQFMLIIWLQGIWLPLHGVNFINTPLQAALDMLPLLAGFLIMGPLSGYLSDKYGSRILATTGMLMSAVGFIVLASFPANFSYVPFAIVLFFLGIGMGMFGAPNTTQVMNSVPPEHRGATSGMRATFQQMSFMFSIIIFFSLLTIGFSISLPSTLYNGLVAQSVSASAAQSISQLPPTAALFAAFLGYNPLQTIIPANVLASVPKANQTIILGTSFFPNLISKPFMQGMQIVLYVAAALALVAALASAVKGPRYINEAPAHAAETAH